MTQGVRFLREVTNYDKTMEIKNKYNSLITKYRINNVSDLKSYNIEQLKAKKEEYINLLNEWENKLQKYNGASGKFYYMRDEFLVMKERINGSSQNLQLSFKLDGATPKAQVKLDDIDDKINQDVYIVETKISPAINAHIANCELLVSILKEGKEKIEKVMTIVSENISETGANWYFNVKHEGR